MLINSACDLTTLAENMGPSADRRDAWAMLELLIHAGYSGRDSERVPRDVWLGMLDVAVGLWDTAPRWLLLLNAEAASPVAS